MTNAITSHPRRALLALLAFVLFAGVLGGPVAGALKTSDTFVPAGAESQVAKRDLERATDLQPSAGVVLLVKGRPAGTRLRDVARRLDRVPGIGRADVIRASGARPALVTGTLERAHGPDADSWDDDTASAVLRAFDGVRDVQVGGAVVGSHQVNEHVSSDLGRAELLALPLLLVLSLLFFGGRAAWAPLVVGVTTVLGTFLALRGANEVYGLSIFALNLVIGLGLGLAIDYTLFLVTRFREELGRGEDVAVPAAVAATMRSAGRTVVYSAATVAVALSSLVAFPQNFLKSMGIAGALVALVAAAAALVATPALLALWGRKLVRKGDDGSGAEGRWSRLAHAVMRRPGRVATVTVLIMGALAVPALRAHWSPVDDTAIPKGDSARQVADTLRATGGAGEVPLTVAVTARPGDGDAVRAYAARLGRLDGVQSVAPAVRLNARTWQVDAQVRGRPEGETGQRVVHEVRDLDAPLTARVTGPAASFVDQQEAIGSRLALAALILGGVTFLVLWLMTGSVVLPVKAIAMNALTVGSALGVLTLVYQDGRFEGLLGYTSDGGVETGDFLVTAAMVFALSTDYGVFLLGRIKEARDAGVGEREAVAVGLARTGRVVTAAAVLLAIAIGAFSTSSISFIQQIGVATAAGVLLDAFVVRSLLVPALMALLGKWNWWSPMWLRRVHDRVGAHELPAATPPVAAAAAAAS